VEKPPDGIWIVDVKGQTVYANQRMAEILGTTPAEMIGHPSFDYTKKPANLFAPKFQRKRLRIKRLAGFFAFIRSNLCTRHIQKKLTPRGHHDWPDKRISRGCSRRATFV
jgi:PAS domain-containing protein